MHTIYIKNTPRNAPTPDFAWLRPRKSPEFTRQYDAAEKVEVNGGYDHRKS